MIGQIVAHIEVLNLSILAEFLKNIFIKVLKPSICNLSVSNSNPTKAKKSKQNKTKPAQNSKQHLKTNNPHGTLIVVVRPRSFADTFIPDWTLSPVNDDHAMALTTTSGNGYVSSFHWTLAVIHIHYLPRHYSSMWQQSSSHPLFSS
jgi:hypothetical protein